MVFQALFARLFRRQAPPLLNSGTISTSRLLNATLSSFTSHYHDPRKCAECLQRKLAAELDPAQKRMLEEDYLPVDQLFRLFRGMNTVLEKMAVSINSISYHDVPDIKRQMRTDLDAVHSRENETYRLVRNLTEKMVEMLRARGRDAGRPVKPASRKRKKKAAGAVKRRKRAAR